jgi:hypothetical protein
MQDYKELELSQQHIRFVVARPPELRHGVQSVCTHSNQVVNLWEFQTVNSGVGPVSGCVH